MEAGRQNHTEFGSQKQESMEAGMQSKADRHAHPAREVGSRQAGTAREGQAGRQTNM